jgi:hypothetical protein
MGRRGSIRGGGFTAALIVVGAILAAFAVSAYATATATKAEWYTGPKEGSVTTLVGKQSLSISSGKVELTFPVASLPITMVANSVSCLECTISNEHPSSSFAQATGKLVLSEVAFTEPKSCKFKGGGKITSEPLVFEANYTESGRWLLRILPAAGETEPDFLLNIEKVEAGKICPFEGTNIPVKGANFGEFKAKMGTFATEQPVNFTQPISEAAGSYWTFGASKFELLGTLDLKVEGSYFGVK